MLTDENNKIIEEKVESPQQTVLKPFPNFSLLSNTLSNPLKPLVLRPIEQQSQSETPNTNGNTNADNLSAIQKILSSSPQILKQFNNKPIITSSPINLTEKPENNNHHETDSKHSSEDMKDSAFKGSGTDSKESDGKEEGDSDEGVHHQMSPSDNLLLKRLFEATAGGQQQQQQQESTERREVLSGGTFPEEDGLNSLGKTVKTDAQGKQEILNTTTASFNDEVRVIPNIPLEYLKTRYRNHANRDIECLLCQHLFKAGKYKVNNTKLRQHTLSKHKEDLNNWLTSHGNLFLPQIRLELYERPWRCSQCTKCYKLKHHLKQHMETAHGETPSGAHKVTIKTESDLESSLTSLPSMDNAAKQFLKLTKSESNEPQIGTLEALVHSAFGNDRNGSTSSKPPSPNNGEPSPKQRKLDSELLGIFNTSGVVPSQLASQISQSLGLNVKIEEDGQMVIEENSDDNKPTNPGGDSTNIELQSSISHQNELDDDNNMDHQTINTTPTRIIPPITHSVHTNGNHNQNGNSSNHNTSSKKKRSNPGHNNRSGGGGEQTPGETISTKEQRFKANSAGVKGQYTCKYCLIQFPDNILYGLHMGQHCVQEPFKCNICSYNCTDRYDFMFHFAMGRHEKQQQ